MSGEITYSGPSFRDSALVTLDELRAGAAQAPAGTTAYEVKPGDNLTRIAQENGYPDLQALLANNPQYAQRNPDLIYPGEVVFVPAAPDPQARAEAAAKTHGERVANGDPNVDGSDQKHYNQAASHAAGLARTTDGAARAWVDAKQAAQSHGTRVANGEPNVSGSDQHHYNRAASGAGADFDAAAQAEISLGSRTFAASNSPGDRADAAIQAGEGIAQRLEAQGLSEAAARVRELAQQQAQQLRTEG
ncbi:LysM peptidoglycan-binding domain-containing protein [Luteimonas sp. RD2P54]|uniref:LysM peptidoglycan-binding domain-containing protein n=1 Tax=Luteimonas endophytica TaxID=3042023 RepID=A0ABT6JBM9_9GAMM|nr:LysM peptidoglycan-binding domain-containing protein [Luteimonas endophytica]MDH5823583.1 LysM peptidoglycan-binding domain-containing protein [Luteimonas endophytica]